tara:strand:+ start:1070 stop:1246 length:177 start_codon:yes stop_codon:yes gene_type:complete
MTMTRHEIRWAQGHDWYLGSFGEMVKVRHYEFDKKESEYIETIKTFASYRELREWAGY